MATSSKRSSKLQEFTAHDANVNCLALGRQSGRVLVTGGEDKKVNLWAIGKENCIMSLSGHTTPITCVKFGLTEDLVCAGSEAGALKVWDLEAAKLVRTLTGHTSAIKCIDFHPVAEYLISGSLDSYIKLWDMRRKGCIFTYRGHEKAVNSAKFSPDGHWIASGDENGTLKIWDVRDFTLLVDLYKHAAAITDVEYHSDDFLLASSSADRSVRFWDLENFELISKPERGTTAVRCLCYSSDGKCLFGGCVEQLKVFGWGPTCVHDTVSIGWGKVQDMAIAQSQLVGASFYHSTVRTYVVNLQRVAPFRSVSSQRSFVRDVTRKSFNKPSSNSESKPKMDIKPIEECETEPEDESCFYVADFDDYKEIFRPRRTLNRSPPPLVPVSNPKLHSEAQNRATSASMPYETRASDTDISSFPINVVTLRSPPPVVPASNPKLHSEAQNRAASASMPYETRASDTDISSFPVNLAKRKKEPHSHVQSQKTQTKSLSSTAATNTSISRSSSVNHVPSVQITSSSSSLSSSSISPFNLSPQPVKREHTSVSFTSRSTETFSSENTAVLSAPSWNNVSSANNVSQHIQTNDLEISNGISINDFLPANYKYTSHRNSSADTPEVEALTLLSKGHEPMIAVLKNRKKNLEVVYSLWKNKDLRSAMKEATAMNDLAIVVDILGVINNKPGIWNLDVCGILLPSIAELLQSKYETYMSVGCDALHLILRNFSSVIRSNTLWSTPTIGVDIPKEERFKKCIKCYNTLLSIRTFLLKRQTMQGKLGQSFRELHTMLQEIDVA